MIVAKSPLNPPFSKGGEVHVITLKYPPFVKGDKGGFMSRLHIHQINSDIID